LPRKSDYEAYHNIPNLTIFIITYVLCYSLLLVDTLKSQWELQVLPSCTVINTAYGIYGFNMIVSVNCHLFLKSCNQLIFETKMFCVITAVCLKLCVRVGLHTARERVNVFVYLILEM
jgi:hypothetical protein